MLPDGVRGGGSHAGAHVHGIPQTVIDNLSGRKACDHRTIMTGRSVCEDKRTASGHSPGGGKRPLVAVAERKTEFLFCAGEMAACDAGGKIRKAAGNGEARECERQPAGGAGAVEPEKRAFILHQPKACGDTLSEQVTCKKISDIRRMQSSLLERQMQGVALQTAFRILPGIAAKQVVFSCKVKQLPERSLLFSAADDRGAGADIDRDRKTDALPAAGKQCCRAGTERSFSRFIHGNFLISLSKTFLRTVLVHL